MLKKFKPLVLLLVLVNSTSLFAQEKSTINQKFSSEELQTFMKIYEYKLNHPFDIVAAMQKSVKKTSISEKRISEILQAQFAGNEIKLSDFEKKELETINLLMEKEKVEHEKEINKFIAETKMDTSKYLEIREEFDNDKDFQAVVNNLYYQKQTN